MSEVPFSYYSLETVVPKFVPTSIPYDQPPCAMQIRATYCD